MFADRRFRIYASDLSGRGDGRGLRRDERKRSARPQRIDPSREYSLQVRKKPLGRRTPATFETAEFVMFPPKR